MNQPQPQPPQHQHSQNYQPINQHADDEDDNKQDPFARLGKKQVSVAHPVIDQFQHQQRLAEIQRLRQMALHPNAGPVTGHVAFNHTSTDSNNNPYSPQNVLAPKHFQRHNRSGSKHSRSQTVAPGFMNRNHSVPPQRTKPRATSRRNKSVMIYVSYGLQ